MDPRQFLFIYGLLIAALVVSFLILKKARRLPTRLKLKNGSFRSSAVRERALEPEPKPSQPEKSLNVFFNYNGHSWDAYEVLGVPAGSSLDSVEKAFADARRKQNGEAFEFIEAAYKAIAVEMRKNG